MPEYSSRELPTAEEVMLLLLDAPRRYRAIRIAVAHWADQARYVDSIREFGDESLVSAILSDPLFPRDGIREAVWRVWLDRPHGRRTEYFEPLGQLKEVSGGNHTGYWQYDPTNRWAIYSSQLVEGDLVDHDPWPEFMKWLHPVVAELLAPASLWTAPEDSVTPPTIEPLSLERHLGREALRIRVGISDWRVRGLWSENLWMGDDYELLVDTTTGILLKVQCFLHGSVFSAREVYEVAFDPPMDPAFFELRVPPRTKIERHDSEHGHRGPQP